MKNTILVIAAVLMGTSAFAETYKYNCFSFYWNGHQNEKGTMSLVVNGDTAKASIPGEEWAKSLGGKININYRSKGEIKFLNYGYGLILEEPLVTGGKRLRDQTLGGIARVEGRAEGGFYQYKFICKRSPSPR